MNPPEPVEQSIYSNSRIAVYLIIVSTILVYLPTLSNSWVNWDDDQYIINNHVMTAPDGLRRIWFTWETKDYYPLTFTLLYFQYTLWGIHAGLYHLVSLVLHVVNALLVRSVSRKLGIRDGAALWIALVFALHPVQVESVAWITEQKNLLYALFGLLSMLSWFRYRDTSRTRWLLVSLALFTAGMFSKAMLVSLPLVLILCDWLKRREWKIKDAFALLPYFVIAGALAWILVRQQNQAPGKYALDIHFSILERVILVSEALWFYPYQIVWPLGQAAIYPLWDLDTKSLISFVPAFLLAGFVIIGLLSMRRAGLGRFASFGLFFYLTTVAPVIGIIDTRYMDKAFVADRYQYTPCLGLIVILVAIGYRLAPSMPRLIRLAAIIFLVPLAVLTREQVRVWKDSQSLWMHCTAIYPDSSHAQTNLGSALLGEGDIDGAGIALGKALRLDPENAYALVGTARLSLLQGQAAASIVACERAIALLPGWALPHLYLAMALRELGRNEEAIRSVQQSVRLDSFSIRARRKLIELLLEAERREEAQKEIFALQALGHRLEQTSSGERNIQPPPDRTDDR